MAGGLAIATRSPEETRILGVCLAPSLVPGDVVSLNGDLGAGKTVFVQGLVSGLGVYQPVTSPTFTLVRHYEGRHRVVHIDVYRLDSIQEVLDLGFEELLDPDAILVVEWGAAVAPLLPSRFLEIELLSSAVGEPNDRLITFRPNTNDWIRKLQQMRAMAGPLLEVVAPEGGEPARFEDAPEVATRDDMGAEQGRDREV